MTDTPAIRSRIIADLLKFEYGIEPAGGGPESLPGGAVLHRLRPPARRRPEDMPALRSPTPDGLRRLNPNSAASRGTMTDKFTKFGELEVRVHPATRRLFPLMADAQLDELAKDIAANGLLHPIEYLRDELIGWTKIALRPSIASPRKRVATN